MLLQAADAEAGTARTGLAADGGTSLDGVEGDTVDEEVGDC